jgi:hypothetical protein
MERDLRECEDAIERSVLADGEVVRKERQALAG